jgi:hypothetical protein
MNGDNMDNARREASGAFRTRTRECLKDKINELETNRNRKILETYTGE